MGGSGGGYDPSNIPTIRFQIQQLEREIARAEYDGSVAHVLSSVLSQANDRDTTLIQTHLETIKKAIEKETSGFVNLLFGGSVAKNTYVAGVSDVDALVIINESELSNKTPLEVRDYFIERLRARLPNTSVEPDGFAVSVKYADGVVQLVPVKRHGETYLLPSQDCRTWSRVRPRSFTEALTAANRDLNGKVVPTIKLAKLALADMPANRRPSGYHLESLALEVFGGYEGPRTLKEMLKHFFSHASQRVLHPIVDRTGQSRHVDDNLGSSGSLERQIISDSLARVARRLQNADNVGAIDLWKRALGVE